MPNRNRRGPTGAGPMTGRGLGTCAGEIRDADRGEGTSGRGGFGYGWGHRFLRAERLQQLEKGMPSDFTQAVLEALRREVEWLQEKLEVVRRQLGDLDNRENEVEADG